MEKKTLKSKTGAAAGGLLATGIAAIQQGEVTTGVILIAIAGLGVCLRDTLAKIEKKIIDGVTK